MEWRGVLGEGMAERPAWAPHTCLGPQEALVGTRIPGHPESHTAPIPLPCWTAPTLAQSPLTMQALELIGLAESVPRAAPEGPIFGTKRRWL